MQKDIANSGFFIIHKPQGKTSHDIVAAIRRLTGTKKVGHTGTLDPMATGVVIVPLSSATRLIQYTHGFTKTYEATMTLGATSTTDDAEGGITPENIGSQPTQTAVEDALSTYAGKSQQIPPRYAAIKIRGKKLYEYARQRKEVARTPRPITIHAMTLLKYAYPLLTIEATVSTGTYIRALARDLGKTLGTGAYVSALHRRAIGPWTDNQAVSMEDINSNNWHQHLHPIHELVEHLAPITFTPANVVKLQQGRAVVGDQATPPNTPLALYTEANTLFGIGTYNPVSSSISPKVILTPLEVALPL